MSAKTNPGNFFEDFRMGQRIVHATPRTVTEGDVVDHIDPEDVAKMLVALWVGTRRISDLDQPEHYLDTMQKAWMLALPSFTNPDRIDYFTQFIKRRHALAMKKVSAEVPPVDLPAAASAHADT